MNEKCFKINIIKQNKKQVLFSILIKKYLSFIGSCWTQQLLGNGSKSKAINRTFMLTYIPEMLANCLKMSGKKC